MRIELFGDEVESIKEINAVTGEIIGIRNHVAIYPASQYVTSKENIERAIEKGKGTGVINIYKKLVENEKYWTDLLYTVCDGKATEIDRLCRFDVFEFFGFISNFEKKIDNGRKNRTPNRS